MQTNYYQALEERSAEDIQDTVVARIERLMNGCTVGEATSDIADESMRMVVGDVLMSLYIDALINSLEPLGVLSRKQVEELYGFLSPGSISCQCPAPGQA